MAKKLNNQVVSTNPLIGKFFHALAKDGKEHYQGHIMAEPHPGYFLVQFFD
jgi:hypothetical protein